MKKGQPTDAEAELGDGSPPGSRDVGRARIRLRPGGHVGGADEGRRLSHRVASGWASVTPRIPARVVTRCAHSGSNRLTGSKTRTCTTTKAAVAAKRPPADSLVHRRRS